LVARGLHVRVVDNLANGNRENLVDVPGENVEFVVGDVRDEAAMKSLLFGTDLVFHLASLGAERSTQSPSEIHEVNASATLRLLNAARQIGVKRFVYVSSAEVYGTPRATPVTEEHPTLPMTVYGASKLAGEAYTRALWETYRFPTVVVRLFDVYGPRCHRDGDRGAIPKLMLRCLAGKPMAIFGDRSQAWDLTFVSDAARGILLAGLSDPAIGKTINLGGGKEFRMLEVAETITHIVGHDEARVEHVEPTHESTSRLLADTSRARALIGFEPAVGLREGLVRLREWYLTQKNPPEELLEQEVA